MEGLYHSPLFIFKDQSQNQIQQIMQVIFLNVGRAYNTYYDGEDNKGRKVLVIKLMVWVSD